MSSQPTKSKRNSEKVMLEAKWMADQAVDLYERSSAVEAFTRLIEAARKDDSILEYAPAIQLAEAITGNDGARSLRRMQYPNELRVMIESLGLQDERGLERYVWSGKDARRDFWRFLLVAILGQTLVQWLSWSVSQETFGQSLLYRATLFVTPMSNFTIDMWAAIFLSFWIAIGLSIAFILINAAVHWVIRYPQKGPMSLTQSMLFQAQAANIGVVYVAQLLLIILSRDAYAQYFVGTIESNRLDRNITGITENAMIIGAMIGIVTLVSGIVTLVRETRMMARVHNISHYRAISAVIIGPSLLGLGFFIVFACLIGVIAAIAAIGG
jgi:hypothetical protein